MSNEQNFDAIIIGAGVIGNAVAFELSKQGLKTLNIDRNHVSGYALLRLPVQLLEYITRRLMAVLLLMRVITFGKIGWHI